MERRQENQGNALHDGHDTPGDQPHVVVQGQPTHDDIIRPERNGLAVSLELVQNGPVQERNTFLKACRAAAVLQKRSCRSMTIVCCSLSDRCPRHANTGGNLSAAQNLAVDSGQQASHLANSSAAINIPMTSSTATSQVRCCEGRVVPDGVSRIWHNQ